MIPDPGAGKVDDGIDSGQRRRVKDALAWIPVDLQAVPRRPADEGAHGMPAPAQGRDKRGADQTGGTGSNDVHWSDSCLSVVGRRGRATTHASG